MLGITDYLWRLIPANPILLRVVEAAGKRRRDLIVRCVYLGLLIAVVLFSLLSSSDTRGAQLAELAKTSGNIFKQMSYLQLALVSLLAPIFTAGAITQEKDSQTYDILLATPLTNGQIVLGSLLSRLFFVVALLVSGIPIFSITQIFGGVAIDSIALSFLIASATAFFTGALAMAIATFKVGTRRTIFSFYLVIAIYLVGGYLLDQLDYFKITLATSGNPLSKTSWLTGLHPFLALQTIFGDKSYLAPQYAELPERLRYWPVGWYLTKPDSFYISLMFFLSLLLVCPSILLLRRLAQSTASLQTLILQKLRISSGDRRRKPRAVWNNPIAWREARTKASAARASVVRWGFIAAGLIGALVMLVMFASTETPDSWIASGAYDREHQTLTVVSADRADTYRVAPTTAVTINNKAATLNDIAGRWKLDAPPSLNGTLLTSISLSEISRQLPAKNVRALLLGAIIVEFAVILLIVTNAAASTVTREKEDGSLDLLLATPITSRYYIWGKLRGLVSFVMPLVAVPILSALFFIIYDFFRLMTTDDSRFQWIVFPEAVLVMPGTLIIVAALASILGMQMSLRCRTTVRAVMTSVGVIVGACAALGWCGFEFLNSMRSGSSIGVVFSSISPFTVMTVLIDPYTCAEPIFKSGSPDDILTARIALFISAWLATGAYALTVWWMYKSMVTNFDMTIRKQSR